MKERPLALDDDENLDMDPEQDEHEIVDEEEEEKEEEDGSAMAELLERTAAIEELASLELKQGSRGKRNTNTRIPIDEDAAEQAHSHAATGSASSGHNPAAHIDGVTVDGVVAASSSSTCCDCPDWRPGSG
eukprot:4310257-Amphidinium_carterae.2